MLVQERQVYQSKRDITEWMNSLSTMSKKENKNHQRRYNDFEKELSSIRSLSFTHELNLSGVYPWEKDRYDLKLCDC